MTALIGDIGGTNVRFALIGPDGRIGRVRVLSAQDYSGLAEAIVAYLEAVNPPDRLDSAALAVASPVTGDRIELTNRSWSFSIEALRRRLRLERIRIVNDFTAIALGIPHLAPEHRDGVGGGASVPGAAIGVIGPGTGLGVSGLVWDGVRWIALAAEGGPVTMAAADAREAAVIRVLRERFGHVSAERLVSGQGLVNLHAAVAVLDGHEPEPLEAADVTARAAEGRSPACAEAARLFCGFLATAASNLALTLGARGGIYIAGGIVPKMGELFDRELFRRRFEDKGRFSDYMAEIPAWIVTHPVPAFLGLAAILRDG